MHPRQTIFTSKHRDAMAVALASAALSALMLGDTAAADFDRPPVIPRVLPAPAPNQQPANPNAPRQQQPANAGQRGGPIRTPPLMFTGTGAALTGASIAGARLRTAPLQFTGTGAALTSAPSTTGPVRVRTAPLTFSGTGAM
jgi:hypothetical protein